MSYSKDLKGEGFIWGFFVHTGSVQMHQLAVLSEQLTINNLQLSGHTALGSSDTIGRFTAVHPWVCFRHAPKLLLQTNKHKVRLEVRRVTAACLHLCFECGFTRVFPYFTHQRALVRVDAVWSVCRGCQCPIVFVPAVGGWWHAEFVLTEKL